MCVCQLHSQLSLRWQLCVSVICNKNTMRFITNQRAAKNSNAL